MGRVICLPTLQVATTDGAIVPDAWAAGDCAAVPDLHNPGKVCPPNVQHAVREGNHLAKVLRSAEPADCKHKNVGAVASLGLYKGVAQMFGRIKVRGVLAWVLHRSSHVFAMPTLNREVRIMVGWTGCAPPSGCSTAGEPARRRAPGRPLPRRGGHPGRMANAPP